MKRALSVVAFTLLSISILAQTIPPTMFGLNVHPKVIAGHNAIPWPTIPFGTFRFWGTETTWGMMNPAPGKFNFSGLETWLAIAQKNGMNDFLYTFGETPAWAAGIMTKTCDHYPGSCNAAKDLNADGSGTDQIWRDFVTAIVKQAAGRIQYWEVWNEPNVAIEWTPTNPKMPYAQLLRMAQDAYSIIKANCPTCQVLSPCPVDAGNGQTIANWFPGYVKADGMQYADIVSFHGYITTTSQTPEIGEIKKVATIKAALGSLNKPIWDTEGAPLPANTEAQAALLARMYIMQASSGVKRFYWFQYGNQTLGTLWTISGLTPSGTAYGQVYKWLVGNSFKQPCSVSGTAWFCQLSDGSEIDWNTSASSLLILLGNKYKSYQTLVGTTVPLTERQVMLGPSPIRLMP